MEYIETIIKVAHDYIIIEQGENKIELGEDTARRTFEQLLKLDYLQKEYAEKYAKVPEVVKIADWSTGWKHILKQNTK